MWSYLEVIRKSTLEASDDMPDDMWQTCLALFPQMTDDLPPDADTREDRFASLPDGVWLWFLFCRMWCQHSFQLIQRVVSATGIHPYVLDQPAGNSRYLSAWAKNNALGHGAVAVQFMWALCAARFLVQRAWSGCGCALCMYLDDSLIRLAELQRAAGI